MKPAITASEFHGQPAPERFNIARHCLAAHASAHPNKTALRIVHHADAPGEDEIWSYRRLEDWVRRMGSGLLAGGVVPGDRVLLRLGNTATAAISFLASTAIGALPIPVSSQLTGREVELLAEDSEASIIVAADGLPIGDAWDGRTLIAESDIEKLVESHLPCDYADTMADDHGFVIYTSGTTSHPKGVLHAHRALWGRRPMYGGWYGMTSDDVVLHAGALNWSYTLGTGFMDPLANGATAVIFAGARSADLWPRLIERVSATLFAAVPTVYRQILKYSDLQPGSITTLRHGLTAGEALRPEVAAEWQARTGVPLYEAFGMSEISTYISSGPSVLPKAGSPGRPQEGRAIALLPVEGGETPVSVGELGVIAVHSSDPGLLLGYWKDVEKPVWRGEWFITGDLATMDEDLYVWPRGRNDDLMTVLGYRVSPVEVEEAVTAHPSVAEAAAVAVEVRPGVSVIKVFVVPERGGEIDAEAVMAEAGHRLAAYKMPREIVVLTSLPRTANGKLRRDILRESAA